MGFVGPLLAGLGTGFANAARQRQQQKWDTEQQQYHDTLNFYEGIAKDPRLNPAYLPQVVSGIAQLHGLKPGKKDHDQLVQTVKGLSSLLQGGEGAPTEDTQHSGLVQNPNPTPQSTQPEQGGMATPPRGSFRQMPNQVQLPPMPQIGGVSVPMGVHGFNGNDPQGQMQDDSTQLRPRLIANGQGQSQGQSPADNGQMTPIALPPAPQLLTQGQVSSKKALPAFVNPNAMKYDLQTEMWLKRIAAQGDNAQTLAGMKHDYTVKEQKNKFEAAAHNIGLTYDAKAHQKIAERRAALEDDPEFSGKTDDEKDALAAHYVKAIQDSDLQKHKIWNDWHQNISDGIGKRIDIAQQNLALRKKTIDETIKQHGISNQFRQISNDVDQQSKRLGTLKTLYNNTLDDRRGLKPDAEDYQTRRDALDKRASDLEGQMGVLENDIQSTREGNYGAGVDERSNSGGKPKLQPKGGGQQLSPEQQEQFTRLKQKRPDLTIEQYLNAIKGG